MSPARALCCNIFLAALGAYSTGTARAQPGDHNNAPAVNELPANPFEILPYRPGATCFRLWREYLGAKGPKAFAVTGEKQPLNFYVYPSRYDHYCGYAADASSPEMATMLATRYCEERFTNARCVVLAIDNKIVFVPSSK